MREEYIIGRSLKKGTVLSVLKEYFAFNALDLKERQSVLYLDNWQES